GGNGQRRVIRRPTAVLVDFPVKEHDAVVQHMDIGRGRPDEVRTRKVGVQGDVAIHRSRPAHDAMLAVPAGVKEHLPRLPDHGADGHYVRGTVVTDIRRPRPEAITCALCDRKPPCQFSFSGTASHATDYAAEELGSI